MKTSPKIRLGTIGFMLSLAVIVGLSAHAGQGTGRVGQLERQALQAYDQGDSTAAAALWRQAALAGGRDAMTAYAGLLEQGDGVGADPTLARQWYVRAAQKGEPHAMVLLAHARLNANPHDTEAFTLMNRAAALGHAFAIRRIAELSGDDGPLSADSIGDHK